MANIWVRLRNALNGQFVSDARPSSDGDTRQTYIETVEKKGGKK